MVNTFLQKIISGAKVIKVVRNWPVYFLDRFKLIKSRYVIYRLRSGEKVNMKTAVPDWRWVFCEVFVYKNYNPPGFEIKKQDVVVDIGAHAGMFSVFAFKKASKVYALEPMADSFKLLQENIQINKAANIYPFDLAVAGVTGKKELLVGDNSFGHSLYIQSQVREKIIVPTISLEDFIAANNILAIDFLKVDCEGAEYDIFFSCPKNVLGLIKKISMECHDINEAQNSHALKVFLEDNGFFVEARPGSSSGSSYLFAKNNLYLSE